MAKVRPLSEILVGTEITKEFDAIKTNYRPDVAMKLSRQIVALKKLDTVTTVDDLKVFIAALIKEEI